MSVYDVAIIGAGPGGYVAAIRCAQLGMSTVIIEKDKIGGTCLNVGCIPMKALVHNAEIIHDIKSAKKRGIVVDAPQVNIKDTMKMKNRVVSQLTGGVEMLLKGNKVTVLHGEAVVKSEHSIMVGDQEISCENLIIATGSSNAVPPIPGLKDEGILTSTELLEIDHIPETLCIIGGGVIGCELATAFSAFGTRVTIVEMMPRLVPNMDKEVSEILRASLGSERVSVKVNSKVTEVCREEDKYIVKVSGESDESIEVDKVLVSIGRKGNSEGLECLGLEIERGYIKTDEHMRTNIANVYAIGDITGTILLAHVASTQGIVAAESIAKLPAEMKYDCVPSCIYTIPEIGAVGLTEEAAIAAGYDIVVGNFPMAACGRAKAMGELTGFTKIVAEKSSGKVLGACIVGPSATEIIGELVYVIRTGGTLEDIKHTIHAHPTITETILEAAHVALGEPIHII